MTYRPRNRNDRTNEAPKSTARWFDYRKDESKTKPFGFHSQEQTSDRSQ